MQIRRLLIALFLFCSASLTAQPADSTVIGPGVVLYQDSLSNGPWHIYSVKAHIDNPFIKTRVHKAGAKLTARLPVSAQAAEAANDSLRVVAAINGDFYEADGSPTGIHMENGSLQNPPNTRSAFYLDKNGRPHIAVVDSSHFKSIIRAIGGGPRLVRDGRVSVENKQESISDAFATNRHPRSALGISRDSSILFLVAVDGRQAGYSVGMSLPELAEYMLGLGAWQAVNLDGGGSTTLFADGRLVNRPSDATGERPVSNSFMVISRAPRAEPLFAAFMADTLTLLCGTIHDLDFEARDRYYNPLDADALLWQAESHLGRVDAGRFFTAKKENSGYLWLQSASGRDSVFIRLRRAQRISVEPSFLELVPGEKQHIEVRVHDASGRSYTVSQNELRWSNVPPFLSADSSLITAFSRGKGTMQLNYRGLQYPLAVRVVLPQEKMFASFTDLSRYQSNTLYAQVDSMWQMAGDALGLAYTLKGGGTSVVYLETEIVLPLNVKRIGLGVFGKGNGHWLRAEFKDKDGELFIADLTSEEGVTWKGWRTLYLKKSAIKEHWRNSGAMLNEPLTFSRLYLVERDNLKKGSGTLFFKNFKVWYLAD